MSRFTPVLLLIGTTLAALPAAATEPEAPLPFTAEQKEAAYLAIGLTKAGQEWLDVCGMSVMTEEHALDLGGDVGEVLEVIVGSSCYGGTGAETALIDFVEAKPHVIFQNVALGVTVQETMTNGVKDIELGVPGFEYPVWAWNGKAYAFARTRKE
ncbi:MAG: hypothetical protein HXY22_10135 [Alphaproteobacteria bacterium]|nr:hypothetical protein [Alphaproteobacteria bacterium]